MPGILDGAVTPRTITATDLGRRDRPGKGPAARQRRSSRTSRQPSATIEDEEERTGSDGHYVNTITPEGTIRRLPLVESMALADGAVLLGDSRVGARLGVRQGISLVAGQQCDDMTGTA